MKKFAKMSLVAAIAVAGLTSTATAGSLEEAIKGVNISGFVEYRLEKSLNVASTDRASEAKSDLDIRLQAVVPVNDMISATIRFDESFDEDTDNSGALRSASRTLDVDRAYFTYMNDGLSATFGLIGTPLTDGSQSDGMTVSKSFGDVSLTAGYLYTSASVAGDDIYFASIAGKAGVVSYDATFAALDDADALDGNANAETHEANFLDAGISGKMDVVSLKARYSSKTGVTSGNMDQKQWLVSASATLGAVNLSATYAANGKDGGATLIDGSDAGSTEITMGALELHGEGDAQAILLDASVAVGAKGTARLRYASMSDDDTANNDLDVIRANYYYQMSSNFKGYLEYTSNDREGTNKASDYVIGAKYSF